MAAVELVGPKEACELLGLSGTDAFTTLQRCEAEDRVLCLDWTGMPVYPRCQFDASRCQVYPILIELLAMRTDDWGSRLALLHWLTRPNRSLGGARPCDRLAEDGDAIVASFAAELSAPDHG